jgi:hypothetical protein
MKRALFISILSCLALSNQGCKPIYQTEYTYTPPQTRWGASCINKCLANRSRCKLSCQRNYQSCVKHGRHFDEKANTDFYDFSYCKEKCGCDEDYRLCYGQCGGGITAHRKCIYFCSKVT